MATRNEPKAAAKTEAKAEPKTTQSADKASRVKFKALRNVPGELSGTPGQRIERGQTFEVDAGQAKNIPARYAEKAK